MKINFEIVIVILTLLFINAHGERSVAFVIDDSYSMNDEIEQVKMQTEQVFEAVFESDESKFNNYVLVTFNDPSSEVRIITNYSQQFKKYLSTNINLIENPDCPEMAMLGILNALNACPSNSVIYVFTDAAAKDYYKFEEVKSLSLKKSIQVTFLLTGICPDTSLTSEEYVAYYKLAEATSGQVFHLSKSNIDKFDVDSKTSNIMISASKIGEVIESIKMAPSMSLHVLDSGNNVVKYDIIMNSKYIMIVKLHDVKPGPYKAKLDCSHDGLRTYMAVKGTTSISFVHGFSEDKPSSLEETSTLPLSGDKTFLAIALENPKREYVKLDMIELIDVNNTIIQTAIALVLVDDEKQFYVTEKINIPDKMFKIKVHGQTKAKEKVARLGKTFIELKKSFGKITDKSPKVTIIGDTEIVAEPNTLVTFKCSVEAYPKPEIVWEKDKGDKFETEVVTVDLTEPPHIEDTKINVSSLEGSMIEIPCNVIEGYPPPSVEWFRKNIKISNGRKYQILEDYTLRFQAEVSGNEVFTCVAKNNAGQYKKHTNVTVYVKPTIKNAGKDVNIPAQKVVDLECLVTGFPKPEVRWLNNSEYIESGSKVQMFRDHKLRFKATIFDTGNYTCQATNSVGEDKITFHVNVYEPAEVARPRMTYYKIELGTPLSLACSAPNGYPKPDVELFHLPKDKNSRLSPLKLKNKKYKLQRAKRTDGGYYICSAKNDYSLSNFTYTVEIQEKPQIDKTTSEYIAIEGDPLLMIPCNASGIIPKPSFTWIRDGDYVANPSETNDGTLILLKPVPNMSDSYLCEAKNEVGKDTHYVDVAILPYPEPTPGRNDVKRPDVTLHEGIRSAVPCSNKPLRLIDQVRWYKDRKLISREKILLINPSVSDNDKYITCRVSYESNSVSYYTHVVVKS
ncbi:hemicentin-1-like [Aricia agestis]|uniref:hemicentin-1-like n=1 Tax=Aricia agestis TaxID=91739 RepID=UPI001C204046|nr:hemicentin-1-like [Aricia agestis]